MIAAYAVYFDHKRRSDPDFRRALKRESRRQARVAKEESEAQSKQQRELIKAAVREALEEGFPTDLEEREAYFMQQISTGEQLASEGMLIQEKTTACTGSLTLYSGSDPIAAALCFYRGLKVYPEPSSLINIYDNTVSKDILEILALMVAQDKNLKVGKFGADLEETSDSHVE
jgi:mitochondrial import receptor subunit TOM20